MNTEQILQKIREANPELKELSFGCEVIVNGESYTLDSDWGIYSREENDKSGYYRVVANGMNDWTRIDENHFKIIGHPVHLEHLLKAVASTHTNGDVLNYHTNEQGWLVFRPANKLIDYDLTKSVEANLESNEALREFISGVLS